jgi:cell wall-associated NlpC family hydrolase
LPDGRTYNHARKTALTITSLTTLGLCLATVSPAAAAPDRSSNTIGAAQARVQRLTEKADAAERRHDKAESTLRGAESKLDALAKGIRGQRRLIDSVRASVASSTVGQYDATGGASAPSRKLSKGSEVLLTTVASVSEDTGARGDQLARSTTRLEQLGQRHAAVRDQVVMLRGLEKNLRQQQARVDARTAQAGATLATLEEKAAQLREKAEAAKMARLGGPVLAYAKAQIGKAYVFGAAGPGAFDCSGLTMMAWKQSGVSLPHSSSAQYASGRHISESELKPGDLVFYYSPISHVGLYIGNGQIVNALNPGSGVRISGLHDMPYSGAVRPG